MRAFLQDTASYANAARTGLAALIVNSDLKLVQFFIEQRFKTDTPPLHSHTAYAMAAGSIIAWGGFAWFQKTRKGFRMSSETEKILKPSASVMSSQKW